MKHKLLYFLAVLLVFGAASAQETIPADAERFYQRTMKEINPNHVTWINRTAENANRQKLEENDIFKQANSYGILGAMNGQDIEAIAFLVLIQAAKSAQEDLKSIMANVKTINEEKEKVRAAQQYFEKNKTNVSTQILDSFRLLAKPPAKAQITTRQPVTTTVRANQASDKRMTSPVIANATPADITKLQDDLKGKMTSLNEMGEMTSLRLQMMMDRRSKFISTLSNIMKKISDTQNTIIQNLK